MNSSGTLDVFPVYEPSPNSSLYVPATSPVTPAFTEGSLHLLGMEFLPPGGRAPLDSLLAYDITLLDRDQDLSLLPVPLLPLPDDFRLLPDTALGQHPVPADGPSQPDLCSTVVSPPRELCREGPFDAYGAPSDTGDHPLISKGLPGCPYRMTSYDST